MRNKSWLLPHDAYTSRLPDEARLHARWGARVSPSPVRRCWVELYHQTAPDVVCLSLWKVTSPCSHVEEEKTERTGTRVREQCSWSDSLFLGDYASADTSDG
jgi:hypothetical protein